MNSPIVKKILKECMYCAKAIGKDTISPNILLHVLSLDSAVKAELVQNNTDIKVLNYILNPYHIRGSKAKTPVLTSDTKDLLSHLEDIYSYKDVFLQVANHRYVAQMIAKSGYMHGQPTNSILHTYTRKIKGRYVKEKEVEKYEKISKHLGKKNIMIMGAIGSGRYEFIRNYAYYNKDNFSIYYFDLFSYLKFDQNRLFGILHGIFDEIGDDYLYIPNFLQIVGWIKSLKFKDIEVLLEELVSQGKIITKVNIEKFESQQFQLSNELNFFSITVPSLTLQELYEILNTEALVFEKFYGITLSKKDIAQVVKESNMEDVSLSQPGRALKRLMHYAFITYGGDAGVMQQPKRIVITQRNARLDAHLKEKIIGQGKAIDEVIHELSKVNFLEGGVIRKFLFQGEIGVGKLKMATELSKILFGEGSLAYIDCAVYKDYPYKFRIYDVLKQAVTSMYGGVIFLDNFEYFDTNEIDVLQYLNDQIADTMFQDIAAPVIIIASIRSELSEIENYPYAIENFDKIIYFDKLSIWDLEKIADIQLRKVKGILNVNDHMTPFLISAHADASLNALGVKKVITLLSL